MQRVAQQAMNDRAKTGDGLQILRFQIGQTYRNVRAKAEAKRGNARMIHPRHIAQLFNHLLMQQAGILGELPFGRETDRRHVYRQHSNAERREIALIQAVVIGLQAVKPAAHQHRRERAVAFWHMQEAGNRRTARNGELQFAHGARQAFSRLFIGAVGQRLRLFGEIAALQVWIGSNAVEVGSVQPMAAAKRFILLLHGLLLPLHCLRRPFVNPVAAAIPYHGVVQLIVGAFGLAHDDTRLHVEDFLRRYAAPDPHQTVNHAIPVRDGAAAERRMHAGRTAGIKPTHQRGRFRVFKTRLE